MVLNSEQKKSILNLLAIIIKISQENKIDIWLIGGSLLGAVRNQSMIEYDDDIDIGIRFDDYQLLKQALSKTGDPKIKLIDYQNDRQYPFFGFSKFSNGEVSLDIFPFNYQAKHFSRIQWINIKSIDVILGERRLNNRQHSSSLKTVAAKLLKYGSFPFSNQTLQNFRKFWLNRKPSQVLINFGSGYPYGHEIIYPDEIANFKSVAFENLTVSIPAKATAILQRQYGDDWQTPKKVLNHQK